MRVVESTINHQPRCVGELFRVDNETGRKRGPAFAVVPSNQRAEVRLVFRRRRVQDFLDAALTVIVQRVDGRHRQDVGEGDRLLIATEC